MFRGVKGVQQPLGQMALVNVSPIAAPYTQLRVAPDGVRMAIIEGDNVLTFGAISGQQGPNPQISLSTVQDDPLGDASFAAVTWYGPDDVITLATPGSAVTEYPISGGSPTSVPTDSNMLTIAASYKQPLIGGLLKGQMAADASLTGSWMPIPDGDTLVSGSLPAYPG
jgi:hypothetical protein